MLMCLAEIELRPITMKKILVLAAVTLSLAANAQTLLYQWAFNNPADTTNASAATFAVAPGTGNLEAKNAMGNAIGTIGTDGINPKAYFTTNTTAGPGSTNGAYVLNGQSYGFSGDAALAWATNLNIGDSAQFTLTYWIRFDGAYPIANGQLPRLVMIGASQTYDNGGNNGVGNSINADPGTQSFQDGIGNSSSGSSNYKISVTNAFPVGGPYSANNGSAAGLPEGTGANNSGTWLFVAVTYDSLQSASNYTAWVGTSGQAVQSWDTPSVANYGIIHFSTNASIFLGNRSSGSRALALGAISDVRFYNGVCSRADLDKIRLFQPPDLTNNPASKPVIGAQPASGKTFVGGSRTFSVAAAGVPNVLTYQWKSNSVPVVGGTNASLTVSNVQVAANGAQFACTVSNTMGATNSAVATLTVVPVSSAGAYAQAVVANNASSFWMVNEASNNVALPIYDYISGKDGAAPEPANMNFEAGPSSIGVYPFPSASVQYAAEGTNSLESFYGFPSTNGTIKTISANHPSRLNLVGPQDYLNSGTTIAGWVYTPATPGASLVGGGMIWNQAAEGGPYFGLTFGNTASGNPMEVDYNWGFGQTSGWTSGLIMNPDEWTFVAIVVSTNSTPDTNVTIYVGSETLGLLNANDSTVTNGDFIGSATGDTGVLALGRDTPSFSENGIWIRGTTSQYSDVAVFNSALSPSAVTNLFLAGVGLHVNLAPDTNTVGNLLLTWPYGYLQSAVDVLGPYSDVPSTNGIPYSTPTTDPQRFYRVRN